MLFKVHKREEIYFTIMIMVSAFLYGALALYIPTFDMATCITIAIYAGLFFGFYALGSVLLLGHLKGSSIKIHEKQLPEIYAIVKQYSSALQLERVPEVYLLQGNGVLNAFATRMCKRNFVVLYSGVLEVAYQEGMDAVSFIIGHELGHIKRNHVSFLKALLIFPASWIPFLNLAYSRAREYTCDNAGFALCPQGATKGLLLLGAGKKLYKQVSVEQLLCDGAYRTGFAPKFAEVFSTHPPLLKRIAAINQHCEDHLISEKSFLTPHIDNQKEVQQ